MIELPFGTNPDNHDVEVEMYYDDIGFTMTDEVVGIPELISQNGLSVYMIENLLNFRIDESIFIKGVEVFDIKGAMIGNRALNSNERHFNMPIDLQSGVYIVRVISENETFTRKFVKF